MEIVRWDPLRESPSARGPERDGGHATALPTRPAHTRLEKLLMNAARQREDSLRRLEDEVRQLERILNATRAMR